MTLDTVNITMKPEDALALFEARDRRNEGWWLISFASGEGSQTFVLDVEGISTDVSIELKSDGTWKAMGHIILGDKKDE